MLNFPGRPGAGCPIRNACPFPLGASSPVKHSNKDLWSHCRCPLCLLISAVDSVQAVAATFLHSCMEISVLEERAAGSLSGDHSDTSMPRQGTGQTVQTPRVPTATQTPSTSSQCGDGILVPVDEKLATPMSNSGTAQPDWKLFLMDSLPCM
jgi:hypothetical protein